MKEELSDSIKELKSLFSGSYVNLENHLILNERSKAWLALDDIVTNNDLACYILEYLSGTASVATPYFQEWRNRKLHASTGIAINQFLGTAFTEKDFIAIYGWLGKGRNHEKTKAFVNSGYNKFIILPEAAWN